MKDTPQIQNAEDLIVLYEELAFLVSQLNSDAPKIKKMYTALEEAIVKQNAAITKSTQNIDASTIASVARIQKEAKLALDASEKHLLAAEKIARRCETALSQMETIAKNMQMTKDFQLSVEQRFKQLESQLQNTVPASAATPCRAKTSTERQISSSNTTTLRDYFAELGFEVIDHRSNGGALWVIGSQTQLSPYVKYVEKQFGISGQYGSSKSTDSRSAWWTKSKK